MLSKKKFEIKNKYHLWFRSLAWAFLFFVGWLVIGFFLTSTRFDSGWIENFKILQKSDSLAYLSAVLAIQIPLFILFLEKMANSGYIYRKLFPRVVRFREIITLLLVGGTLVLLSPRNSYLYLPILVLFFVNAVAVFRALTTVFQPEAYDDKINGYLKRSVDRSFTKMLDHRKQHNEFFKKLEELEAIKRSFLNISPKDDDYITLEVRSDRSGFINGIDIDTMIKIRNKEFNVVGETKNTQQNGNTELDIEINLSVSPTNSVRRDSTLLTIGVPKDYKELGKLRKQLLRCFDILPTSDIDVRWFEELLSEFDQQLNKAILASDTILINQTFSQLQVVLDSVDEFIKSKQEDDYKLGQAFEEISRFAGDELSKGLEKIFEILSDLTSKSVRNDQPDINREIVRFIYRNCLDSLHTKNISSIARYDRLFTNAIALFIYSNVWNKQLSATQRDVRESLLNRLKEHTDVLVYELKEIKDGGAKDDGTLQLWFERRLSDIRSLALAAFTGKLEMPFSRLVEILQRVERDRYYDKLSPDTYSLIKCNILMLAAYIHHKDELSSEYGKSVLAIINAWTEQELMSTFIGCVDEDYADKWRINTHDLLADGEMHSVPSYDLVIKSLWVDVMLGKTVHTRTEIYGDEKMFEKTFFFTNGSSTDNDNPLLKMVAEKDPENKTNLKELIEKLIAVRRNWETTKLAAEDLDLEKIQKLSENVNKAYLESSLAEKIFSNYSVKADKSNKEKGYLQTGINQVFDKEAFIKEWHIGYGNDYMGEQLGSQIANNQDRNILSNLTTKPTVRKDLGKLLAKLKPLKDRRWLVVVIGMGIWSIEHKFKEYVQMSGDGNNDLFFKDINQVLPIQSMYLDGISEGIYFIDADKLGTIKVKSDNYDPPVKVEVTAYSKSDYLMDGLVGVSPKWLQEKGDEVAQRAYLSTKVRLLVERVFKHIPPKSKAVYYVKADEDSM